MARGSMRHAFVLLALTCVPEPAVQAAAAAEQPVPASALTARAAAVAIAGEYRYAGGERERQRLLDAIESVVAQMNFIARPIARKRLRESNMPSAELHILVAGGRITIVRPGRPTVSAPADGTEITWTDPDGDDFRVRHRLLGLRTVTQDFVGKGSRSKNVFALDASGAVASVSTTIDAKLLPKTLRFRTTYRRK